MYGTFTLSGLTSQTVLLSYCSHVAVRTPERTRSGLGSSVFARRYSQNRCFFLFLRLLRCFSSAGSLPYVMDWRMDTWGLLKWVSPFRNQRVIGYLLLTAAYRSLSRLSSALSAKASTLRPFLLNLPSYRSVVWCGLLNGRYLSITLCSLLIHLSMYQSNLIFEYLYIRMSC